VADAARAELARPLRASIGVVAFIPSSAASAARASASPRSPPSRSASSAGSQASIIVLSPGSALPRDWTPLTPASTAAVQPSRSSSSLPAEALPICRNSVPYNGPAAPPTLETNAIPTALRSAPMSPPSVPSSFSTAFFMPRSMFVPWSPSPIAVSSRTSSMRCAATTSAKRRIQSRTCSAVTRPTAAQG
jgi:hypothetical protein